MPNASAEPFRIELATLKPPQLATSCILTAGLPPSFSSLVVADAEPVIGRGRRQFIRNFFDDHHHPATIVRSDSAVSSLSDNR